MRSKTQFLFSLISLQTFMIKAGNYSTKMVSENNALKGRVKAMDWTYNTTSLHFVNQNRLLPPFPEDTELAMFGMGCFWGAEKMFWKATGIYSTHVGYSSGFTINPTYKEVCSGKTGHNEVVRVAFYPKDTSYSNLLKIFWEGHDPTQGMKQGVDTGTQYRSGIYYYSEKQRIEAEKSKKTYEQRLVVQGFKAITTEIKEAHTFYYAEKYHQQYLAKNPGSKCDTRGTGVTCPIGLSVKSEL